MNAKQIIINMAMLGLFVFAIMSFIVITQTDSSVTNKITTNPIINESYGDLESKLIESETRSKVVSDNFGNVTPTQIFGELDILSIIGTTRTVKTLTTGFWNILIKLPLSILGVSPVVAGLITAILLISLIIGIWAIWKGAVSQ